MGDGFPIMMDAIFSEVIAEDVNDDGKFEIIASDTNGNVVCFDVNGKELWESRVSGYSSQAPTIGDVDGDGVLDVVVATTEGHVFAM